MSRSGPAPDSAVVDAHLQQREGSLAARFERLLDLYAPMTEQPDGTSKRDPEAGVISKADFLRLLEHVTQP